MDRITASASPRLTGLARIFHESEIYGRPSPDGMGEFRTVGEEFESDDSCGRSGPHTNLGASSKEAKDGLFACGNKEANPHFHEKCGLDLCAERINRRDSRLTSGRGAVPRLNSGNRFAAETLKGVHMHRHHLADSILFEAAVGDGQYLDAYRACIGRLRKWAADGRASQVNEKIDGAMSIVFGLDERGRAFVAYKGGLFRKDQRLIRNLRDLSRFYPVTHYPEGTKGPRHVLRYCVKTLLPQLKRLRGTKYEDMIFQADVLFVKDDQRRSVTAAAVTLRPNQVSYQITAADPNYSIAKTADLGMVVHTMAGRVEEAETGRLVFGKPSKVSNIRRVLISLAPEKLFIIQPVRDCVPLQRNSEALARAGEQVGHLLGEIDVTLRLLGAEFRKEWRQLHLRHVSVFFNSMLRPPADGAFYRAAKEGAPLDVSALLKGYEAFVTKRLIPSQEIPGQPSQILARARRELEAIRYSLRHHGLEFSCAISAYFNANKIQYLLMPLIAPALSSLLGGGPSEGIMLEETGLIFKLVDRLEYTLANNARWHRNSVNADPLPAPLERWRPGSAFMLCGWRFLHSGHVATVKAVLRDPAIEELIIITSPKAPSLKAASFSTLGVARTKARGKQRDYQLVMSARTRCELIRLAFDAEADHKLKIRTVNPSLFWSYVQRAKEHGEDGKIKFVCGEKEILAGRYASQLATYRDQIEPYTVQMQYGGISATKARRWLREYSLTGSPAAHEALHLALSYVEDRDAREATIQKLVREWKKIDRAAQRLLGTTPKRPKVTTGRHGSDKEIVDRIGGV